MTVRPGAILTLLLEAQVAPSPALRRAYRRLELALDISKDLRAAGFSEEDAERVIAVLFRGRIELC